MNKNFEHLRTDEVISVEEEIHKKQAHIITSTTLQVSELLKNLSKRIGSSSSDSNPNWIFNGFDCQVLRLGATGWVKGRIKLTLEFYPDEPEVSQTSEKNLSGNTDSESPLDDLRQKFNQENQ